MSEDKITEDHFRAQILSQITHDFDVRMEWPGIDASGKRRYLDALIIAKPHVGFRKPRMAFGIEFKAPDDDPNMKRGTMLMNQALVYSYTNWDKIGTIPILMCELNLRSRHKCTDAINYVFRRLMGTFNVGTIETTLLSLEFRFSDTVIYDTLSGVTFNGKNWKAEPKL
jgi:hypothetical protein